MELRSALASSISLTLPPTLLYDYQVWGPCMHGPARF